MPLLVCSLLLFFALSSGEHYHLSRTVKHDPHARARKIHSKYQVELMLKRYAYLKCAVPEQKESSRKTREVHHARVAGNWPGAPSSLKSDAVITRARTASTRVCTAKEVRAALVTYQRIYGLNVTGTPNAEVERHLSRPRCGVTDGSEDFENQRFWKLRKHAKTGVLGHPVGGPKPRRVKRSVPARLKLSADLERHLKELERNPAFGRRKRAILQLDSPEHRERLRRKHEYRRVKRSVGPGLQYAFPKTLITYRYIWPYSQYVSLDHVRFALKIAFRYWSEVSVLDFIEDNDGDIQDIDIEIAFGKRNHLDCSDPFDGEGGEVAHSQPLGPMHLDDDELFSLMTDQKGSIYLIRCLVHEIGHTIGLKHMFQKFSLMFPFSGNDGFRGHFELPKIDRVAVQSIYGKCSGKFDAIIDWILYLPYQKLKFSTYFFRDDFYWLYESSAQRPRYGDPNMIQKGWPYVPKCVDAVLQVWLPTYYGHNLFSMFIKGDQVYVYNLSMDRVEYGYPRAISAVFGGKERGQAPVPNNLDAAFFDRRLQRILFFKGDMIYIYDPGASALPGHNAPNPGLTTQNPIVMNNCCERRVKFWSFFQMANTPNNRRLTLPIDTVYFSFAKNTLYFFKGNEFWADTCFAATSSPVDSCLQYKGLWPDHWYDICDI